MMKLSKFDIGMRVLCLVVFLANILVSALNTHNSDAAWAWLCALVWCGSDTCRKYG